MFYLDSIRNPGDYSETGTVYMSFKTTLGGQVDSGSYSNWPDGEILYNGTNFIETFTVSASNMVAGQSDVTYFFDLLPHSRVVLGAYLFIDLPSELEVENSN